MPQTCPFEAKYSGTNINSRKNLLVNLSKKIAHTGAEAHIARKKLIFYKQLPALNITHACACARARAKLARETRKCLVLFFIYIYDIHVYNTSRLLCWKRMWYVLVSREWFIFHILTGQHHGHLIFAETLIYQFCWTFCLSTLPRRHC